MSRLRSVLIVACVVVASAVVVAPADASIVPIADCIVREPTGYRVFLGYYNTAATPAFVPNGPNNYFSPDPNGDYFGQPINFLPGEHRRVFALMVPYAQTTDWIVLGTHVTVSQQLPSCDPRWAGAWDDAVTYRPGDMVRSGGSSWIAVVLSATDAPSSTSSSWELVAERGAVGATGSTGPAGPSAFDVWSGLGNSGSAADFLASLRGPTGVAGPAGGRGDAGAVGASGSPGTAGPAGSPGVAGAAGSDGTPGSPGSAATADPPARTLRFPRSGVMTVRDRTVTPASFVLVQYADPKADPARATNVVSTGRGSFRVRGAPGVRFRYAVR